jgi:hypothetical protein
MPGILIVPANKAGTCYCHECEKFVTFREGLGRSGTGGYHVRDFVCKECGGRNVSQGTEEGLRQFYDIRADARPVQYETAHAAPLDLAALRLVLKAASAHVSAWRSDVPGASAYDDAIAKIESLIR